MSEKEKKEMGLSWSKIRCWIFTCDAPADAPTHEDEDAPADAQAQAEQANLRASLDPLVNFIQSTFALYGDDKTFAMRAARLGGVSGRALLLEYLDLLAKRPTPLASKWDNRDEQMATMDKVIAFVRAQTNNDDADSTSAPAWSRLWVFKLCDAYAATYSSLHDLYAYPSFSFPPPHLQLSYLWAYGVATYPVLQACLHKETVAAVRARVAALRAQLEENEEIIRGARDVLGAFAFMERDMQINEIDESTKASELVATWRAKHAALRGGGSGLENDRAIVLSMISVFDVVLDGRPIRYLSADAQSLDAVAVADDPANAPAVADASLLTGGRRRPVVRRHRTVRRRSRPRSRRPVRRCQRRPHQRASFADYHPVPYMGYE